MQEYIKQGKKGESKISTFKKIIKASKRGKFIRIDLKDKNIRINGKEFSLNNTEDFFDEDDFKTLNISGQNIISDIEVLYEGYKHSVPQEKRKNQKPYFKALSYEELDEYDLIAGEQRNVAQTILEAYILLMSLAGNLKWPDETKWYYQSKLDKDFVLLRQYV